MNLLTNRTTELYSNPTTPHCVVRIGVLFRAANNSREDVVFCGFFIAVVRSVMGDQAGGAEKLAVALTVRQLLFRSSTQLALGWRLLPLLEQIIMQNLNIIPSAIRPFAAILSFEVPTTELDPDFVPSISVCVGEFETLAETETACRSYANHPALIAMRAYQSMLASDYVGGGV